MSKVKARIVGVGTAGYTPAGRPGLEFWIMEGGPGFNYSAHGPDEPAMGGWTFRELHAIANGIGPDARTDVPALVAEVERLRAADAAREAKVEQLLQINQDLAGRITTAEAEVERQRAKLAAGPTYTVAPERPFGGGW